jgi:hypothetical protein
MVYEVNISMAYNADSPEEAAQLYLNNIRMHTDWYIKVRCVDTDKEFTVDSADWEVEEE